MRIVLPMDIEPPAFRRIPSYMYDWAQEDAAKKRSVYQAIGLFGLIAAAVAWFGHRYLYETGGYAPGFSTLTGQHSIGSGFIPAYTILLAGLVIYTWTMAHAIFGRPLYRWNKAHFSGDAPILGWWFVPKNKFFSKNRGHPYNQRATNHAYVPRYVLVLLATALLGFWFWHVASNQSVFASELSSFAILLLTATAGAFLVRWTPVNSLGANI
jgi:hypothetical protein